MTGAKAPNALRPAVGAAAVDAARAPSAESLLAHFQRTGDQASFEEVVRRYAGMVFAVCLSAAKNAHDAEDATQAVFLRLALELKMNRPVHRLGPWLRQVAKRSAIDVRRARARRERHHAALVYADPTKAAAIVETPRGGGVIDDLHGVLTEELARLPAKYRIPLVALYFGGTSRDEVARELGIKPVTLGVRLHRGRQMLAKRIEARSGVSASRLLGAGGNGSVNGENGEGGLLSHAMADVVGAAVLSRVVSAASSAACHHGSGLATLSSTSTAAAVLSTVQSVLAGIAGAAKLKAVAVALAVGFILSAALGGAANAAGLNVPFLPDLRPAIRSVKEWIDHRVPTPSFPVKGNLSVPMASAVSTQVPAIARSDDLSEPKNDRSNHVHFALQNAQWPGDASVSLLALDRADVSNPQPGHALVGRWSLDLGQTAADAAGPTVQYDDAIARRLGLDDLRLKLSVYRDGQWSVFANSPFDHDLDDPLLAASAAGSPAFFAVSVPEPASALLLSAGVFAAMRRRKADRRPPD